MLPQVREGAEAVHTLLNDAITALGVIWYLLAYCRESTGGA